MKLKPQIFGYERKRRVFSRSNLVSWILCLQIAFLVAFLVRYVHIKIDPPCFLVVFCVSVAAFRQRAGGPVGGTTPRGVPLLSNRGIAFVKSVHD